MKRNSHILDSRNHRYKMNDKNRNGTKPRKKKKRYSLWKNQTKFSVLLHWAEEWQQKKCPTKWKEKWILLLSKILVWIFCMRAQPEPLSEQNTHLSHTSLRAMTVTLQYNCTLAYRAHIHTHTSHTRTNHWTQIQNVVDDSTGCFCLFNWMEVPAHVCK